MLHDPRRQRFACDVEHNDAFKHADQRTRDVRGDRLVDSFRRLPLKVATNELHQLLGLPADQLVERLRSEPLARTNIPKRRSWESSTKPVGGSEALRPIVKQTYLRRCIGNLVADILDVTSDPLLPNEAIAYRRGRRDPVQEGIRSASEEVRRGRTFWAKLDIKSFFPSMPWKGIRASLEGMGYPGDFIDVVMALVQTDIYEQTRGELRHVPNDAGAQAGLRESSILANIYLADLDREVLRTFGRSVFYRRYSDDILLLASSVGALEGAVNVVRAWLLGQGLTIKDIERTGRLPRGQRRARTTRSLVHAVSKKRVEFLGAEIGASGRVTIPRAKEEDFVQRIDFMLERLVTDEAFVGDSGYAVDDRGTDVFDVRDIQDVVEGFGRYWEDLAAHNVSDTIDSTRLILTNYFDQLPRLTSWVARLARSRGPRNELHGEAPRAQTPLTHEQVRALFQRDPFANGTCSYDPLPSANQDCAPVPVDAGVLVDGVSRRGDEGRGERDVVGGGRPGALVDGRADADVESEAGPKGRVSSRRQRGHRDEEEADRLPCTGREHRIERQLGHDAAVLYGEDVAVPLSDDEYEVEECSSSSPSFFPLAIEIPRESPRGKVDHQASRPLVGSPMPFAPQSDDGSPLGVLRTRNVYIVHRSGRSARRVLMGVLTVDGPAGGPSATRWHRRDHDRHESLVVDVIRGEVHGAQQDGLDVLVVRLMEGALPKTLLQARRAFRSVPRFDRVERLHAEVARGTVDVLVAGPCVMPASLIEALDDEWERG